MSMYSASLHPSKSCFVAGGEDFKLYKFDFEDGKELGTFWVFLCYFVCMLAHIFVCVCACVCLFTCVFMCLYACTFCTLGYHGVSNKIWLNLWRTLV